MELGVYVLISVMSVSIVSVITFIEWYLVTDRKLKKLIFNLVWRILQLTLAFFVICVILYGFGYIGTFEIPRTE